MVFFDSSARVMDCVTPRSTAEVPLRIGAPSSRPLWAPRLDRSRFPWQGRDSECHCSHDPRQPVHGHLGSSYTRQSKLDWGRHSGSAIPPHILSQDDARTLCRSCMRAPLLMPGPSRLFTCEQHLQLVSWACCSRHSYVAVGGRRLSYKFQRSCCDVGREQWLDEPPVPHPKPR